MPLQIRAKPKFPAFVLLAVLVAANFSMTAVAGNGEQADAGSAAPQATTLQVVTEKMYPAPARQPNYGPAYGSIEFVDTDPGISIGGTLSMGRAVDGKGMRLNEVEEGITAYMVHWGLQVGIPGVADDQGAGDLGGDCRGFRDTGHVVMTLTEELQADDDLSWEIPMGTEVPDGAIYFVGHTLYGDIHNLGKCTQTPIHNMITK